MEEEEEEKKETLEITPQMIKDRDFKYTPIRTDLAYINQLWYQSPTTISDRRYLGHAEYMLYLCKGKRRIKDKKALDRNNKVFFAHLLELYNKQEGRCVLSKLPLIHPTEPNQQLPDFLSIDRLDNSRSYEVGNVQLLCHNINQWIRSHGNSAFHQWMQAFKENEQQFLKNLRFMEESFRQEKKYKKKISTK